MATDTVIDVVMPQMGVSVSEGTITRWLKQVGDPIAADETLLEISTDKVDTEIPSPGEGIVQQIFVQEGETVDVGTRSRRSRPRARRAPAPAAPAARAPRLRRAAAGARTGSCSRARARGARGVVRRLERQDVRLPGGRPHRLRARHRRRAACPARAAAAASRRRTSSRSSRAAPPAAPAAPPLPRRRRPRPLPPRRRRALRAPAPVAAGEPQVGETFETMSAMRRGHRRAHAPLARHVGARHERDRGRHVPHRRASAGS